MNNPILCSTGTLIGRENGFDYRLIPVYAKELDADGFELMMLPVWYDILDEVAHVLSSSGVSFRVMHAEKEIGTLLSTADDDNRREAIRLFELNCKLCRRIGSRRLVLHLWGGKCSDSNLDYNIGALGKLLELTAQNDIELLIENIPSVKRDPLTNWADVARIYPNQTFLFDTRFGALHSQLDRFCDALKVCEAAPTAGKYGAHYSTLDEFLIGHMHISDFGGPALNFKALRPILHPGEGIIDFEDFFARALPKYHGTITLESPVLRADGSEDIDKLNNTLNYIRRHARAEQ